MTVVEFPYKPIPVFEAFHASVAADRAVIGGFGSGKSTAGCAEAIRLGLEHAGAEILVTRKTAPALRDTTEKTFVDLLPPEFLKQCEITRAGGHLEHVTFPNGSNYLFRSMDDWRKLRSLNLAFILWDEADEFTEDEYNGMQSRVRQTQPLRMARDQGHKRVSRNGNILASNPAGRNWIWRRFVGPDKDKIAAAFLSSSLDNPFLTFTTLNRWLEMPDAWVQRFVFCSFDDFAGAIYPDFQHDTHVIQPYGVYPQDGHWIMGFDPGTFAGNAAVWCFYDAKRHALVAAAEYNETGLAATAHADAWSRIEVAHRMRPVRLRIADPVITTRDRGSNMQLSDQYRRLGYSFQPGPRSIETRLWSLGQLISQRRFLVTADCPRLIEQLKEYRWEKLTPTMEAKGGEAKPLKKNVDLVDAAQYIATRYIHPPAVEPDRTDQEQWTHEIWEEVRRDQRERRSATTDHDLGSVGL